MAKQPRGLTQSPPGSTAGNFQLPGLQRQCLFLLEVQAMFHVASGRR